MPSERAPTPQSHTTLSIGDSEDRNSERSDSVATIEIFRSDGHTDSGAASRTPSENTEESENTSRHRAIANGKDIKNFIPTDIPEIPLERKKSNGLSKGVILSAMNFGGSYDLKCDPKENKEKAASKDQELSENSSKTPKAVEAATETSGKASDDEKGDEKKKMSLPRKIAFGFSFLPSVMFVLTFAVILPCEEYQLPGSCVKNKWSFILNQTEIGAYTSLPQMLLFAYQSVNASVPSDGLISLNVETGNETWRRPLDSYPKHLECGNIDVNRDGIADCLTVLNNGDVCAFNSSNGNMFWNFPVNQVKDATTLLTGCRYKDHRPIGIASYSKENVLVFDIVSEIDGSVLISKEVRLTTKCLSSVFSMQPWNHDNGTDLVYYCVDNTGFAHIWRVKHSDWCPQEDGEETKIIVPEDLIMFDGKKTDAVYFPTTEGLVIWTSTGVSFLLRDGKVKWQYFTDYSSRDRIVKYGSFYLGGEQVALIARNNSHYTGGNIVVSVLESENGKELIQLSYPYKTVNQAVVLKGNETDALLIAAVMVKEDENVQKSDKEVVLRSNISSSETFRSDVTYDVTQRKAVEDLLLLQFEGSNTTQVVFQSDVTDLCWKDLDVGAPCKSEYQASRIVSASSEKEGSSADLKIIVLRAAGGKKDESQSSQLSAFDITLPDSKGDSESTCTS